jgi:hypothetical protein
MVRELWSAFGWTVSGLTGADAAEAVLKLRSVLEVPNAESSFSVLRVFCCNLALRVGLSLVRSFGVPSVRFRSAPSFRFRCVRSFRLCSVRSFRLRCVLSSQF